MRQFELALHPNKTRLIRFGRHAAKQREKHGEGKPETFDFLGFTHFCTRLRKWGSFVIGRKTVKKRMRARLAGIKIELRRTMHDPIAKSGACHPSIGSPCRRCYAKSDRPVPSKRFRVHLR